VACHPRRKHLMYVRGKINLSEREESFEIEVIMVKG
jgi:hypothetical protein